MKVEITITIEAEEFEWYNSRELERDIRHSFVEATGYELETIEVTPQEE